MLLGFSSALFQWQKLTASSELLHRAILKVRSQPVSGLVTADPSAPGTMLYDAIHSTAIHQLASVPGRKAIVVISDGIDRGSRTKPESAIRAVQATDTIVYAICYGSGLRWVPEKSSLFPGCDLLQQLVEPTGGRLFKARKKMTFSKIFDVIQEELHSQYSLGYVPTNSKRDGSFRRLQIRLKRRGIKAQARQGYYANPAPRKASDIADAP
jgi:VWFA-related protein